MTFGAFRIATGNLIYCYPFPETTKRTFGVSKNITPGKEKSVTIKNNYSPSGSSSTKTVFAVT